MLFRSNNEVHAISTLIHPNIVKMYESNNDGIMQKPDGRNIPVLYIVLELISGGEVCEYLCNTGRFSDNIARYYYHQLIDALEFIHSKGFAHRDIKANNVLLDSDYKLKVADFGFAAHIISKDGPIILNSYRGTTTYMAPELIARGSYLGDKVDIFATGVFLAFLVLGIVPFNAASSINHYYKMFRKDNKGFWKLKTKGGLSVSQELIELINALLSFYPKDRPSIEEIKKFSQELNRSERNTEKKAEPNL